MSKKKKKRIKPRPVYSTSNNTVLLAPRFLSQPEAEQYRRDVLEKI